MGLRLFLVHGRAPDALLTEVYAWFSDWPDVSLMDFDASSSYGASISTELVRQFADSDAVIVLATADDVGGLRGDVLAERARQNVWFELSWAVARFGYSRTLLVCPEALMPDKPTDYDRLAASYRSDLSEAKPKVRRFLDRLTVHPSEDVTEIIRASSDVGTRDADFEAAFATASRRVVISGTGMDGLRSSLELKFGRMLYEQPDVLLDVLVFDPDTYIDHTELFVPDFPWIMLGSWPPSSEGWTSSSRVPYTKG